MGFRHHLLTHSLSRSPWSRPSLLLALSTLGPHPSALPLPAPLTECPERLPVPACAAQAPAQPLPCLLQRPLRRLCDHRCPPGSGLSSAAREGCEQVSGRLRSSASFPCPGGPAPHRLPAVPGHTPSGALSAVSTTGDAGPQTSTLFSLFSGRSSSQQSAPYPLYLKPQPLPTFPSTPAL